ncbi:unnamed protein product, partial [marine sediment metagenome]
MNNNSGFKRILLVNLPILTGRYTIPDFPPIGIGYLSQTLAQEGIEHDVVDMMLGYKVDDVILMIKKHHYDLVGFSLLTYQYLSSYDIITAIKNKIPSIRIIVGGPHVSTFREEVLRECDAIDFGVVMEGEIVLRDICKGELSYQNIPGLIYRTQNEIK